MPPINPTETMMLVGISDLHRRFRRAYERGGYDSVLRMVDEWQNLRRAHIDENDHIRRAKSAMVLNMALDRFKRELEQEKERRP